MRKWYQVGRGFTRRLRDNDVSAYASSIAFFLFLSMIPILMLICSVLPYTPLSQADLMEVLREVMPDYMDAMIVLLVNQVYQKSTGILSFAILMTIWSAGKGMLALMRALNAANGVVEERGYFRLRAVASLYTLLVLAAILVTLCLGVFGKQILTYVLQKSPLLVVGITLLNNLRFLFVLLFLSLIFTLMYTYIPNKGVKFLYQIPGAVFASCAWNICSFGFSVYVDFFNPFSAYGSLGMVIIFLLWMYFYCYIMLVGAHINQYFQPVNEYLENKHRERV